MGKLIGRTIVGIFSITATAIISLLVQRYFDPVLKSTPVLPLATPGSTSASPPVTATELSPSSPTAATDVPSPVSNPATDLTPSPLDQPIAPVSNPTPISDLPPQGVSPASPPDSAVGSVEPTSTSTQPEAAAANPSEPAESSNLGETLRKRLSDKWKKD